ncbi:MAG: hypothetical protein K0R65_987 [Crocinitomicaceae bacterium]|jgi:hypothetical protein|nr:hypothetical protein [Crocinitomicaceae bacterium]
MVFKTKTHAKTNSKLIYYKEFHPPQQISDTSGIIILKNLAKSCLTL